MNKSSTPRGRKWRKKRRQEGYRRISPLLNPETVDALEQTRDMLGRKSRRGRVTSILTKAIHNFYASVSKTA